MFSSAIDFDRPHVMGIVNVTPDSFSDGGELFNSDRPDFDLIFQLVDQMQKDGATFVDVGGQTTKPGFKKISTCEEIDRVVPVVERIKERFDLLISVDTSTPEVMGAAMQVGADLINDVEALSSDGSLALCAEKDIPVVLMHSFEGVSGVHSRKDSGDLIEQIVHFFKMQLERCSAAGIKSSNIILDPGFGFGKSTDEYKIVLNELHQLTILACPILVGLSRKKTISTMLGGRDLSQRMAGGLGMSILAYQQGARLFRTHDVAETFDALTVYSQLSAR